MKEQGHVRINRAIVIVLDSVGVGALPDAHRYGDEGTNTLLHTAEYCEGLHLPTLASLGLGQIVPLPGVPCSQPPQASYGRLATQSKGKDTTTGHWELMGVVTEQAFPTYPNGFPKDFLRTLEKETGRRILRAGNRPVSGTVILEELGEEHVQTGALIVYTSADSVMQIAAHEEVVPAEELYAICEKARSLTQEGSSAVSRVIARPFAGQPGSFFRIPGRRDFSLSPPGTTVLDALQATGVPVTGIGKIGDIYNHRGLDSVHPTASNQEGMERLLQLLQEEQEGLLFINLVDFDSRYGHRRDAKGYGAALEAFDLALPAVLHQLGLQDLLIITADHGNDPTHIGTDHTREYAPLLCYLPACPQGKDLGVRSTLADVGATVAEVFGVLPPYGESFLQEIQRFNATM